MAYRRSSRSSRGRVRSYSGRRSTRSRRRVPRRRGAASQRIVIQVVGPQGGAVPISGGNVGTKGAYAVRRRF